MEAAAAKRIRVSSTPNDFTTRSLVNTRRRTLNMVTHKKAMLTAVSVGPLSSVDAIVDFVPLIRQNNGIA